MLFRSNPWFIRNLVADSPVPWVIASTLENVPRQAQALEFSHAQWISRVADHLVARGRKRVACVFNAGLKIAPTDLLANILRSRGLEVPRAMTQGMTPGARAWTSRIVELQFTAPAGQRPDALVIADDKIGRAHV